MSRLRRLGLGFGLVLVAGGLAVAAVPGLAGGIGFGSAALTAVGLGALVLAVRAIRVRLTTTDRRPELPSPERRRPHPTPGDGFDGRLAALGSRGRLRGARDRRAVRERLEGVAIRVLVRDGLSEAAAREALARGTWTDDPHAAAFFAEASATDVPIEDRLRAAFSTEPLPGRRARHAIDALSRRAGQR